MDFLTYHLESSKIRDIDPANDCLKYICDRFELSIEQRYWLAFLYSTCYCAPTVYYIYNEFPDFENVNVNRLQRWWDAHKKQTVFQTDRLRIKTGNKLVETYQSYQAWVAGRTQAEAFGELHTEDPVRNYLAAYRELENVRNVGRFTLFIYLEMINVLTDYKCLPDKLEWRHADNCRRGLCYSLGLEDSQNYRMLDARMDSLLEQLQHQNCEHNNIFNVETTLCAYKKYCHGKRYIGYYIDRQLVEINKMKANVTTGVAWRVMDEFRSETYKHLNETSNDKINFNNENILDNWFLRNGQDLGHEKIDRSHSVQSADSEWALPLGD